MSREMTDIIRGNVSKTYTLPPTVVAVCEYAFCDFGRTLTPVSVRFSSTVETLGNNCFAYSGIRQLVLPSRVRHVGAFAFYWCKRLAFADLCRRCFAQTGLEEVVIPSSVRHIGRFAFGTNGSLRQVRFFGVAEEE